MIIGAMTVGYSFGHYNGLRAARDQTYFYLCDFARHTDLGAYLKSRGQSDLSHRLTLDILNGSPYEMDARNIFGTIGLVFVTIGLCGLFFKMTKHEKPAA